MASVVATRSEHNATKIAAAGARSTSHEARRETSPEVPSSPWPLSTFRKTLRVLHVGGVCEATPRRYLARIHSLYKKALKGGLAAKAATATRDAASQAFTLYLLTTLCY